LRVDTVDLKNRLCDIETDCRDRVHDKLLGKWGLNGAHNHGTCVPVEEPSTASVTDIRDIGPDWVIPGTARCRRKAYAPAPGSSAPCPFRWRASPRPCPRAGWGIERLARKEYGATIRAPSPSGQGSRMLSSRPRSNG